ncbi:MAG TPA: RsmE family RNA methyltransferase [Acidobacteriota bacterium]
MTANRFFLPHPALPDSVLWIEGGEHHHLSRVARVRQGETIDLFDEEGSQYRAVVEKVALKKTLVRILSRHEAEKAAVAVVLAPALLKSQAMEFLVQRATEIGLSALVPVMAERSVVKIGVDPSAALLRWSRIAREAAKQCKTGLVPDIKKPQALEEFLSGDRSDFKLVLSEGGGAYLRDVLIAGSNLPRPGSGRGPRAGPLAQVCLLVGPEGGWSPGEETRVRESGFRPVSLGRSVLRTETAALCAAFLVNHFWNP